MLDSQPGASIILLEVNYFRTGEFFAKAKDSPWYSGVAIAGYGKKDFFPGFT